MAGSDTHAAYPEHSGSSTPIDITDFQIGPAGARDLATLALAADGSAVIAAQTNRSMRVVRVTNGTATDVATFTAPDGTFFGQQTKVGIDAQGRIHVVWWQSGESSGTVCHGVSD